MGAGGALRVRVAITLSLTVSLGLGFQPLPAPRPAAPADCGQPELQVPDFSLVDVNPGSDGYGQSFAPDDFLSKVLVVYWATAT